MAPLMSDYNRDGLGYAAIDKSGNMFGERWLTNSDAFKLKQSDRSDITQRTFGKAAKPDNTFTQTSRIGEHGVFGTVNFNDIVAITMHTRMATSARGFNNVHPFVHKDTSVIHNGVISNDTLYKSKMVTTCDSENILHSYLENKVATDIDGIAAMAKELAGYYACAVISRDAEGNRILDVFKAHNNSLTSAYIKDLETFVITTNGNDIKKACDILGFEFDDVCDLQDGNLIRFNPYSGEIIHSVEFEIGKRWEYSGNNYTPTQYNGGSTSRTYPYNNVIDMTKRPKMKNLSKEELDYMMLPASIEKFNDREMWEYFETMGWGYAGE
jgi:hypothetical protein